MRNKVLTKTKELFAHCCKHQCHTAFRLVESKVAFQSAVGGPLLPCLVQTAED